MEKAEKVEAYFTEEHQFKKEIAALRELVLKYDLEETFKWSFPTYTLDGKNVLSICKFKKHFGIWFFNGVFLTDKNKVLENAQEGKTKAMRQWKFKTKNDIDESLVITYIKEAIENQKAGKVVSPKKSTTQIPIPEALLAEFKKDAKLKAAYEALTAYKQKEFNEYIVTAKREATKLKRLEKIIPIILEGKGLNDKYR